MREPYSIEAEHGVLGAMMLRSDLIDVLSDGLTPADFYFEDNAAVYRAILDLHQAGKGVEFMTVGEYIRHPERRHPRSQLCRGHRPEYP